MLSKKEQSMICESLFQKTYIKHRAQQQRFKIDVEQINDPEYADIDDPEYIIDSFNAQIEKIKQMCVNTVANNTQGYNLLFQYEFDFPSIRTLKDIMKYLKRSITTMQVPIELIMNPLIFIFLDKILENITYQKDESMIKKVCSLYISLSLYDYFELMDTIINKYSIFLLNSSNGQIFIGDTEKEMYIIALSNLLFDENPRTKLITIGIHNIIYQILYQLPILSTLFQTCLNYFVNLIFFLKPEDKENTFFTNFTQFLINNIISNFSLKLTNNNTNDIDDNDEHRSITVLIIELKALSMLLEKLVAFGLSCRLENCANILITLACNNDNYHCISEHLFEILKFIANETKGQSIIFTDNSFLIKFVNIFINSSINAKIQGIELLIILSPLLSGNASLFQTILQNFQSSEADNNFEYWEHICFFSIIMLANAPVLKRREMISKTLVEMFLNALETRVFVNQILKLFLTAKQSDPDFWGNFLIENDFLNIISNFSSSDFEDGDQEDNENAQIINLLIDA